MSGKRQKTQCSLALEPNGRGETSVVGLPRAEPLAAKTAPESPAVTEQLMEVVCDGENLRSAWKRVRSNQGSPGVDGMTIDDAKDYLREHWPSIRSQLLDGPDVHPRSRPRPQRAVHGHPRAGLDGRPRASASVASDVAVDQPADRVRASTAQTARIT